MFHAFVDNVLRWALVDDKPKILLDTIHETNHVLYPDIYSIISIVLTLLGAISNKERSLSESLLKIAYGRYTIIKLIHRHVQIDLDMIIDEFVSRRNQRIEFSSTYTNEKLLIIHDE